MYKSRLTPRPEGTWEHRRRQAEMEQAGPRGGEGPASHHIGDYIPPGELAKFREKYKVWPSTAEAGHIIFALRIHLSTHHCAWSSCP
jgi:hypothetical protein